MRAAVQVKKAAARANHATGRLPDELASAIVRAADEILGLAPDSDSPRGQAQQALLIDAFRVDPFQAGAGVSHNMNTNEVLANRAIEILAATGRRQRQAWRLLGRQPQRPREHGPVHQRHLPDRDARGDARPDR